MIKGAYLHIPFCDHICFYCDFNKYLIKNQPVDHYLDALEAEIRSSGAPTKKEALRTLFVGGGTPTALTDSQLERFLNTVKETLWHPQIEEYTFEANPENLTYSKLQLMKALGVNRLSIGVQTFQEQGLEAIGRVHSIEDVTKGIQMAREIGFHNLSIDLMFGLPGQTEDDLNRSIDQALALNPEHISIYAFKSSPRPFFIIE